MPYTITMSDIRDYLATLQMDQSTGNPGAPCSCLVANALAYKYGGPFSVGPVWAYPGTLSEEEEQSDEHRCRLGPKVGWVVFAFDRLESLHLGHPPTRAEVERELADVLKEEEEEQEK